VIISLSTLYYELKRGTAEQLNPLLHPIYMYFAQTGQVVYKQSKQNSRIPFKLVKVYDFLRHVEEQGRIHHLSPDAIRGDAFRCGLSSTVVSTNTLYNYINKQLIAIKNIELPLRVRLQYKPRKDRAHRHILGASIEDRDIAADTRTEFGH
jgi:transposase, IS30 family